jgi:hypothetical protein
MICNHRFFCLAIQCSLVKSTDILGSHVAFIFKVQSAKEEEEEEEKPVRSRRPAQ